VAPVAQPEGLAEFAAAAARAQPAGGRPGAQQAAPTLRAKGIDDEATPALTYSGPSEDGGVAVQHNGGQQRASSSAPTTRRERREAARKAGRRSKR
jgi:preprotein translocase subunit SecA